MQVAMRASGAFGRADIARYRSLHGNSVVYRAAARLWAHGLDWESAHDIANDAFQTAQVLSRPAAE